MPGVGAMTLIEFVPSSDMGEPGKRVLVAGATGYLGRHLVQQLSARGYWVRALARSPEKMDQVLGNSFRGQAWPGDAQKPGTLRGMCDGVDVVISTIGLREFKRSPTVWDIDYQGNMNVFAEAKRAGVAHAMFISVAHGERPDVLAQVPMLQAREKVVQHLRTTFDRWTVIRGTGFFNDMEEIFNMCVAGRAYVFANGRHRINPVHGRDLANRFVDAIEKIASAYIEMGL